MSDVPIKKWKGTKARVEIQLRLHPEMRDDLDELIAVIWWNDFAILIPNVDASRLPCSEFINALRKGKLTPPETIRRTWQKLQMENPELRGKNYKERHKTSVEVRASITNQ